MKISLHPFTIFNIPHPYTPGYSRRGAIIGSSGVQLAISNRAPESLFLDCLAQLGVDRNTLVIVDSTNVSEAYIIGVKPISVTQES